MSDRQSQKVQHQAATPNQGQQEDPRQKISRRMASIRHKILIVSGKGGVGKSTVAVQLAAALRDQGKRVGLLDADIHGPSLAKMLGADRGALNAAEGVIEPRAIRPGLSLVSMAYLLQDADTPVIWRGPLKMRVISQFLGDVNWGQLDYLVVDAPPGTGDEPLSVAQLVPDLDGVVVVTTPQDIALLDARKSVGFARAVKVPVIGIVENMSGLRCPHCGAQVNLFKRGGGERAASELQVPFLGRVPIEPQVVQSTDSGTVLDEAEGASRKVFQDLVRGIRQRVEGSEGDED